MTFHLRERVLPMVAALLLGVGVNAHAATATIYDNSVNDLLTRFNPGTLEIGDEITLSGSERWLTHFSFEYWGVGGNGGLFSGAVQARVHFYLNDGLPFNGYATPGTSFFDSGWFSVPSPTSRDTFNFGIPSGDFPGTGLYIPAISNMTWSVQFQGMGLGDSVGVDLYSAPVVGGNTSDYWQNSGANWSLMTNTLPMDFAARFRASLTPVPEPSSTALFLAGSFCLLAMANARRRVMQSVLCAGVGPAPLRPCKS